MQLRIGNRHYVSATLDSGWSYLNSRAAPGCCWPGIVLSDALYNCDHCCPVKSRRESLVGVFGEIGVPVDRLKGA